MPKFLKIISLVLFFLFAEHYVQAQTFSGKNKMWKKHRGNKERHNSSNYNPYIDHDTNKPKKLASKELAKENKRTEKQQKKNIRKEKRKLRRQGKGYSKQ